MTLAVWLVNEHNAERYVVAEDIDDALRRYRAETNIRVVHNIRAIDFRAIVPGSADMAQIEIRKAAEAEQGSAQKPPTGPLAARGVYR